MERILTNALLALPLVGAFSMFALGIVVIYRASRVLNLAHGAMAALPAYLAYSLSQAGVPMALAVPAAIGAGALLGVAVHRFVLRPLGQGSETTQTVGTVAVLGVLVAVIAKVWGTAPLRAPAVFPEGSFGVGRSILQVGEIGLAVVALIVAGALTTWFRTTDAGLAMRGAAENPRAAALMGVDPERTTMLAWALGGAMAATAGVLLAAVTNLQPFTLSRQVLPAFVAALLGGLGSLSGALIGSLVVGLAMGIVPSLGALGDQTGSAQLVLAAIALLVMASRGERFSATSGARQALGRTRDAGEAVRLRAPRWLGRGRGRVAVLVLLLAWPWLPLPETLLVDGNFAAIFTIVAVSLVVLTGWVGQISLAHASFVGVAAFTTGLLTRSAGLPFPANLPVAAAVAAGVAMLLGVVALRVRGLYLAVATLIFGWMADAYLFNADWLVGAGGSSSIGRVVVGREGAIPSFDLADPRMFWYVALAAAAFALVGAGNLRDSGTGRAFAAVRGSEVAASSLGIDVTRTKLFAFGFSGVLAGIAGSLLIVQGTVTPDQFEFADSLFFLSIAVVGGLTRLGGAVAASILFAGLNEVFFRVEALGGYLDLVSSGLLLAAVLASAPAVRAALRARLDPLLTRVPWLTIEASAPIALPEPATPEERAPHPGPILDADGVTVRFGGLVAAERVSIRVDAGEIIGLIGPNGAGKTTVFNAISGLNSPAEGAIRLFGRDVTALPPHQRAALGLGRTFQIPQVFGDATVFENLLVATHLHRRSGPLQHLFVTDTAAREERTARARVVSVLRLTELEQLAHARCADLPFGVLRMVEVARALVTGARFIMLDEPASGLDDTETERLGALLRRARDEFGVSLLLVEHDVRFVTGLSDRLYVIDRGKPIADGDPETVRTDPAVIAAYLGSSSDREPATLG